LEPELFADLLAVEADDGLAVDDGGRGGLGLYLYQFPYRVGVGTCVLLGELRVVSR